MDRDYTKDAEQEILVDISNISGLNSQFQFSTSYQGLGVQEPINGSSYFSLYQSDNSTFYGNMHGSHIPNAFERVRNYDATAAGMGNGTTLLYYSFSTTSAIDMVSGHSGSLSAFKSNLEKARDALKVSEAGYGVTNIINALSENDDIANGSIFGDSYEYAKDIEEKGFKEEAGRSNAYYKDALDRVFDVENGVVTYDMDEVEAIMSKNASDITEAEYYAVSLAFTYMNEGDMEKTICLLMGEGEDVDLPWYQNANPFDMSPDDYSEWHLDEDKYNEFCKGMDSVSNDNICLINLYDQNYADTDDIFYVDVANSEEQRRMTIVQRNALVQSLRNVTSFRAEFGEDVPTINISYQEDKSLLFEYKDHVRSGNSTQGGRESGGRVSYGNGNWSVEDRHIIIGQCLTGAGNERIATKDVSIQLHETFANGFTSEGYEDGLGAYCIKYLIPLAKEEEHAYISNSLADTFESVKVVKAAVPYADVLFTTCYNMATDYMKGKENAAILDGVDITLNESNVFDTFDCCVCKVTYYSSDDEGYTVSESPYYVEGGRNTNARIYMYNELTGSDVNVDYLVNNPSELAKDVGNSELNENGFFEKDLGDVSYSNLYEKMRRYQ